MKYKEFCKILGGLYGGSSKLKADASPFKTVLESAQEESKLNSYSQALQFQQLQQQKLILQDKMEPSFQ